VDQRTDIWAFGCLLYELLTGKRTFAGTTVADTIAAVLEREPDWQALPAKAPAKIRDLLRRCLQKDPSRRLSTIADARRAIEEVQRPRRLWPVAAAVAAAALIAGAMLWPRGPVRPTDSSQWVQLTRFTDSVTQPALSRDGKMVAFIRGNSTFIGPGQVYVKILPDGEPVQLTHDGIAKMMPAFSPDGSRIAYTTYLNEGFSWDTWSVPVPGGEPQRWLKNASGLVWTDAHHLLFSEIKMGLHMGIVASDENRMGARDVYMPSGQACMAHRSYLSPDGKSVLLVEMDDDHLWESCRLAPMDGSSPGRKVGPAKGGCTFADWSPDGKWMFFTSNAVGENHIWRQRFPDGKPEMITSGPTAEEGIAVAPDGRSLITAVALKSTSLRIHDSTGEREVAVEGNAADPKFTADGRTLYYRIVKESPSERLFYRDAGEVRAVDLRSGRSEPLVRGLEALDYDLSPDGRQVVLEVPDEQGKSRIWLAQADRSAAPRPIPNLEGTAPRFGREGEILFRRTEGSRLERTVGSIYRVRLDGSGVEKASEQPVLLSSFPSSDHRWLEVWAPQAGDGPPTFELLPLDGGQPVVLGAAVAFQWSPDGETLAVASPFGAIMPPERAYFIPLRKGQALPPIPAGGFHTEKEIADLPGARKIDDVGQVWLGPGNDVYAFYRGAVQRNLYRIPLP
jgi:eukaryotic-like serine/threonine-protein kinase